MPQPAGLGGFVEQEWARFWQGWNALSPAEQSRLEAQRQANQGARGGQPTINVPGWNDAVHFAPQYQPTRQDRQEYQRAMSEGRPPLLTPDVVAAVERQNDITGRIANSAQPGYSQAFGQMMTALDNIQDAISTAATLGRVAAWPALGALARFSPRLAAKAGGYLMPGIGWLLGAADLLNLLTWLGMGGLIGYGVLCGGGLGGLPPLALQAATRGLPTGRPCTMKGAVTQVAETNPFSTANRLKNTAKAAKKFPGFGKWLEVGQTTDQLFGRGISFGALYGMVMEAGYAAAAATQGAGFRWNVPALGTGTTYRGPAGGTLDYATARALLAKHCPETARRELGRGVGELRAKWQLARVLVEAPALLCLEGVLSLRETASVVVAWYFAHDAIARELAGGDVDGLVADLADVELSPLVTVSDGVADLLSSHPRGADSMGRWTLEGAPRTATGRELVETWAELLPYRVQAWLEPIRSDVAGMFLGAMVNECAHRSFQTLTQDADPFRTRWEPDFVVLTSLMDAGRFPSVGDGGEVLWSWWQELRELVREEDRRSLLPRELDESAVRHGVTLFHAEQAFLRSDGA